jgi:CheY-like chemotaxis protein
MERKILVVDDVVLSHDVIRYYTEPFGISVDGVTSGQQAVDIIREEKVVYNAVFVDQIMPETDGIETARRIREIGTKYAGTIPLIAITADLTVTKDMFLIKGFQDFVSKPVDALQLEVVIRRWVCRGLEDSSAKAEINVEFQRSFVKNVPALIEKAKSAAADNPGDYAIHIHGIKGACQYIHEDELSKRAAQLEKAAKSGDLGFVRENGAAFLDSIERLITTTQEKLA